MCPRVAGGVTVSEGRRQRRAKGGQDGGTAQGQTMERLNGKPGDCILVCAGSAGVSTSDDWAASARDAVEPGDLPERPAPGEDNSPGTLNPNIGVRPTCVGICSLPPSPTHGALLSAAAQGRCRG